MQISSFFSVIVLITSLNCLQPTTSSSIALAEINFSKNLDLARPRGNEPFKIRNILELMLEIMDNLQFGGRRKPTLSIN